MGLPHLPSSHLLRPLKEVSGLRSRVKVAGVRVGGSGPTVLVGSKALPSLCLDTIPAKFDAGIQNRRDGGLCHRFLRMAVKVQTCEI